MIAHSYQIIKEPLFQQLTFPYPVLTLTLYVLSLGALIYCGCVADTYFISDKSKLINNL